MFTITFNQEQQTFTKPIRISDIYKDIEKKYPVAMVNNRMREMSYRFEYDADVEFLTLEHPEAVHVYEASLRYLIAMAFKHIYPTYNIKFKYSVSRSVFCYIVNDPHPNIEEVVTAISAEMKRLIALDIPFTRITTTTSEAKQFYLEQQYQDRIDILEYRPDKNVHFYQCGDYKNYMYSYMVPSTGYLSKFNMFRLKFLIGICP